MSTAREDLLAAGLAVFDRDGFEGATVAEIRSRARASNGSFFHFFASKKELAGTLFLEILQAYHAAIITSVDETRGAAEGVARLIHAHLDWVVTSRREARFLFEISRSEWSAEVRGAQRAENARLADGIERWRAPLLAEKFKQINNKNQKFKDLPSIHNFLMLKILTLIYSFGLISWI